jgi:hypothetical protein
VGNDSAQFFWLVICAAVVFVIWRIVKRGKRKIALREASSRVLRAEAVAKQAQEDLRVAAKYARNESLTDEELLTLSYFAVNSGVATPQQEQLVKMSEAVKASSEQLSAAREAASSH